MSKQSVGGIWKKNITTKNGQQEILSITIDGKRYTAWVNGFKKADNQPDYQIYVDDYKPKEQTIGSVTELQQKVTPQNITEPIDTLPF